MPPWKRPAPEEDEGEEEPTEDAEHEEAEHYGDAEHEARPPPGRGLTVSKARPPSPLEMFRPRPSRSAPSSFSAQQALPALNSPSPSRYPCKAMPHRHGLLRAQAERSRRSQDRADAAVTAAASSAEPESEEDVVATPDAENLAASAVVNLEAHEHGSAVGSLEADRDGDAVANWATEAEAPIASDHLVATASRAEATDVLLSTASAASDQGPHLPITSKASAEAPFLPAPPLVPHPAHLLVAAPSTPPGEVITAPIVNRFTVMVTMQFETSAASPFPALTHVSTVSMPTPAAFVEASAGGPAGLMQMQHPVLLPAPLVPPPIGGPLVARPLAPQQPLPPPPPPPW